MTTDQKIPDIWVEVLIEGVFELVPTTNKKIKTKECKESGLFPVIDQSQTFISGYIDDQSKVIQVSTKPLIVFGDHTRVVKWVNHDFVPGADGTKILSPLEYVEPRYFYYYLRGLELPDKGYARHYKYLKESTIKVAPLAEQKQIADRLDALLAQVDTLKTRLDAIPTILKRFRQSVLAAAVSGKLTEKWRGVGKFWKNRKLGDIFLRIESGKSIKCDERPPLDNESGIVKISAVTWGEFNENESKTLFSKNNFLENRQIKKGDFLISRANTIELVGAPVIVKIISKRLMLSDKVLRLVIPDEDKAWVKIVLTSGYGRQQIESKSTGNQQSMRNISQKALASIIVPSPSLEEQTEIVRRVDQLFAFADQIEQRVSEAKKRVDHLTQSILAKAFRGDLTAEWRAENPDLINGENSAEALLERIKSDRIRSVIENKNSIVEFINIGNIMISKEIIPIVDALKEAKKPLKAQELLAQAGYPNDADTDNLEQFFLDIREQLKLGTITRVRQGDDDIFELVK